MDPETEAPPESVWMRRLTLAGWHLQVGEQPRRARVAWILSQSRRRGMRLADKFLDRRLGTRDGVNTLLDHFHPDHTIYEASGWTYLARALRPWEVDRDDVFADLGCGRGRVLLLAARWYPLRRVIGVDISAELVEHARSILDERCSRLRCRDYEVVHSNAKDWAVPDDVTIVYLYFPFSGDTLRQVVANLVASLDRNPRRMRILYAAPKQTDALLDTGRFRLVRTSRTFGDYVLARIAIYESAGPDGRGTRPPLARIKGFAEHAAATARETGAELRRTRRLLREGGLKNTHGRVRPLTVDPERELVVMLTLRALGASCLERALILQAWQAYGGDPRDLIIGVTTPGSDFGAHAWLDGHEEPPEQYHELVRLPAPAAADR